MEIELELGLISPPVGLNAFVVNGITVSVAIGVIIRTIWPFWVAIIFAFPIIALLPQLMSRKTDNDFAFI